MKKALHKWASNIERITWNSHSMVFREYSYSLTFLHFHHRRHLSGLKRHNNVILYFKGKELYSILFLISFLPPSFLLIRARLDRALAAFYLSLLFHYCIIQGGYIFHPLCSRNFLIFLSFESFLGLHLILLLPLLPNTIVSILILSNVKIINF